MVLDQDNNFYLIKFAYSYYLFARYILPVITPSS